MSKYSGYGVLALTLVVSIALVGSVLPVVVFALALALCLSLTARLVELASVQKSEIYAVTAFSTLVLSVFAGLALAIPLYVSLLIGLMVPVGVALFIKVQLPPVIGIFKSERNGTVFRLCRNHVRIIETKADLAGIDFVGIDSFDALCEREKELLAKVLRDNIPTRNPQWIFERLFGIVSTDLLNSFGDHETSRSLVYKAFTRSINPVIAAVLLLILSPLIIVIGLLIVLTSGMSPFFTQERLGLNNTPFEIYKFKTMRSVKGAPEHEKIVTPLGRFLRRWKLDELPQLYNVVRGEMTFIGPRPEWTNILNADESVPVNYNLRHLVKPGITGWAQVNYRYTSTRKMRFRKMQLDLYYIRHGGLAMDLLILLRTMFVLIRPPVSA